MLLKIKTDSNNQIDIENKSIEVSDRVSTDGAVTITAKAPTEIKIIKATAAKAIITEKGEIPISEEDAKSVRRVFNVIRSPITTNIEANKKDANSGLPNGSHEVQFLIYAQDGNYLRDVYGFVEDASVGRSDADGVLITLHLDDGVMFFRDVVPYIKKTREWKSFEALYGKYLDLNFNDPDNVDGYVYIDPYPTEETPKVVSEDTNFQNLLNGESDIVLNLDRAKYAFIFGTEVKGNCGRPSIRWQNFEYHDNEEEDPENPSSKLYEMFCDETESVNDIIRRFKAKHPELDFNSRAAYYIQTNTKMPPMVKITEETGTMEAANVDIFFKIEQTIDYRVKCNKIDGSWEECVNYEITAPQGNITLLDLHDLAVAQNPEIAEFENDVNLDERVVFNKVYDPDGRDDENRISWRDAAWDTVSIEKDRYPNMYIEEIIIRYDFTR